MSNSILHILKQDCLYQTKRLTIASWKSLEQSINKKDLLFEDVLKIMTPIVTKDLPDGWQHMITIEEAEAWVAERINDSYFYTIQKRDNEEMIGFLFLYIENEIEETTDLRLGYLLGESIWGKGLGSELIMGLVGWCKKSKIVNSISGGVEMNNLGSIRVLEKNGFMKSDEKLPDGTLLFERKF